jgi:hypothetical protein
MWTLRRLAGGLLIGLLLAMLIGCGKDADRDDGSSGKEFRIPDSLLAPIEGYNLIQDDYHPIKGGVMANADIVLHYPASTVARYIAVKSFGMAQEGLRTVTERIGKPAEDRIYLVGAKDLDEYLFLTRKEWWYYGVMEGDTITFEPLDILIKRGIAQVSITQKIAQMALRRISNDRLPLWLREATASHIAGEREILVAQVEEYRLQDWDINPSPEMIDRDLRIAGVRADTRIAFGAAYRMLEALLELATIDDVLGFARKLGAGDSLDAASREAFGLDYAALLETVRVDTGSEAGTPE